jgi:hypothetical protein
MGGEAVDHACFVGEGVGAEAGGGDALSDAEGWKGGLVSGLGDIH